MTVAGDGSLDRPEDARLGRLALAVVAPLAIAAAACILWWVSDRLVEIGPFDRATFGWIVVVPIWLSAPVVAGLVWRRLGRLDTRVVAVAVGAIVSAVAATLFWRSVTSADCANGATHQAADWLIPSVVVGLVIGAGLAASSLLAAAQFRGGHPWRALTFGAAAELGLVVVAILVAASMLLGPGCQRPPV